ncbi:hypothetical protein BBAD15_g11477 [Beauveria bassiana D1-5]|uniref:Uncharacterized protein n=1 Tax=Beauveria bassiana D1-5 TaxID=1245745 RepID=A0A0A2V737_BEABA|nr:hypothetical protein BBAD15_g11477 [Beauveria bassiana D1-5]
MNGCAGCFSGRFTTAITGATRFPQICCSTPIPLEGALSWLPAELVAYFERKQLESNSPNPRDCPQPRVRRVSPTQQFCGRSRPVFPMQSMDMYFVQSGRAHDGMCPDDPLQNEVQTMAKREGTW